MKKALLSLVFLVSVTQLLAQGPKQDAPIVRLGDLDTANVTCDALLKHTKLVAADARWVVTKFTISFILPEGKVYGPYATQGGELSDQAIRTIKRLKNTKAEISIVEISVASNGKEKFTYPISLRYNK